MRFSIMIAMLAGLIGSTALTGCAIGPPPALEIKQDEKVVKQFKDLIGGMNCSLDTSKQLENFSCTSLNDGHVEFKVSRLDRPFTVIKADYLGKGKPVVGTMPIVDDARYLIEVRLWQSGIDLLTCAFVEDMSCFEWADSDELSITILP